ncbi:uncharacterized protein LOC100114467 isoform X2 [Nasonia vitripennis]|uniref:Uncharacterized protein n=1 Tax=Nasonia vitripennis TaxID=7425 RepID=A0A7M7T9M5_NASVI|nr:uncharacterized protein LOC100114467 isoform X2 [Nasonia vitripennis]XP_031785121.1 uncharacterized protein LOC100114467 isoform X2 [Nasonia vitripennis]XP_032455532.1 uncharacterized protein LOC100114467 isoform X2 [Nasonia vitripennis]
MRFSGLFTCHGGYSGCSASHPLAWRFRFWSIGSTTQYRRLRVIHLLYSFGSGPAGQLPNSDGYGCSSAGLCLLEQLRLLSKRSDGSDGYGCGSAGYSPAMVATVAVLRVIYLLGDFGSGPSGQLPSTYGCGSYTCSTVSVAVLPVNYPIRTAMVAVQQAFACLISYGCCPKGRLPGSDGYGCGSAGYSPAMVATVAVLRVIHLLGDFGSGPSGQLPSTDGCGSSTCSIVSVAVLPVNYPIRTAMVAVQQAFACLSSYGCCPKGRTVRTATDAVQRVIHLPWWLQWLFCESSTCLAISALDHRVNYPVQTAAGHTPALQFR